MDELEEFEEDYPSKSERKREVIALQALAIKLADLPVGELAQLPIPDALDRALIEYRRMRSHGAVLRQAQFLGKVMRKVDSEAIVEAYDKLQLKQKAQQQKSEQWRAQLMEEGKVALTEFINAFPDVDRQKLRQLIKEAVDERDNNKHPGAQKNLFRYLNQYVGQL